MGGGTDLAVYIAASFSRIGDARHVHITELPQDANFEARVYAGKSVDRQASNLDISQLTRYATNVKPGEKLVAVERVSPFRGLRGIEGLDALGDHE